MWDWDDIKASPSAGDCSERFFTADTPGISVLCEVKDDVSGEYHGSSVTIKIDKTPPTVTSANRERSPDYNGWFNHPVTPGAFVISAAGATNPAAR